MSVNHSRCGATDALIIYCDGLYRIVNDRCLYLGPNPVEKYITVVFLFYFKFT